MIKEQEELLRMSDPQLEVFYSTAPLTLDMAGQGAGKTHNISFISARYLEEFPKLMGFIGANTMDQLNGATLKNVFKIWEEFLGYTEYDKITNPYGEFIIDKIPPPHFKRFHKLKNYHNTISFKNGALIMVGSLENYKAHDGKEFGWAHLDETKDTKESALKDVIIARLRQVGLYYDNQTKELYYNDVTPQDDLIEKGYVPFNPLWIHTSPSSGGVDWLIDMFELSPYENEIREALESDYDFFIKEDKQKKAVIYQSFWNETLPRNYITNRASWMSKGEILKFIYGYPFSKSGGEYYPSFQRAKHVSKVEFNPDLPIRVTYDFNVLPYVTQELAQVDYVIRYMDFKTIKKYNEWRDGTEPVEVMQIKFFKEYAMRPPKNTTAKTAEALADDFEEINPTIFVHGDASGYNRIVGLGEETQYSIILRELNKKLSSIIEAGGRRNKNPNARRNFIDKIFEEKVWEVEIIIDPECKELVRDLDFLKEGVNGKLKEKETNKETKQTYEKIGHTSDAFEYLVTDICEDIMPKYQ